METLKVLNNKQVKQILQKLNEQFACKAEELSEYAFFRTDKGRLFLISKKLADVETEKLRINRLGLYFGKEESDGIRLSIEGAQLIKARKNIASLNDEQAKDWMRGTDFNINTDIEGYVILKHNSDILGCGKIARGKLLNYVPKERRIVKRY